MVIYNYTTIYIASFIIYNIYTTYRASAHDVLTFMEIFEMYKIKLF